MVTWKMPSLHEIQILTKENLMKILYYVPESDYYYCDDVIMKELEEKKSRQEIF